MNIINAITVCAVNYEVRTGETPSNVYLGRDEMLQLKEVINDSPKHSTPSVNGRTFNGMDVYPVDADSHLEVS